MRRTCCLALVAALAAATPGCNEYELRGNEYLEVFEQTPSTAVDILFVVDNSPSMVHEHTAVVQGFGAFINEVMESDSDFHIGVTTTDMETNEGGLLLGSPNYITTEDSDYGYGFMQMIEAVGVDGSGWEKGLGAAKKALFDAPAGFGDTENTGFMRYDADLAIVVVSDENDCSDEGNLPHMDQEECYTMDEKLVPVVDYINAFQGLKPDSYDVTFSAIVGPEIAEGCDDTKPGFRYLAVAQELEGLRGDICQNDWSGMMGELGLIASGLNTFFVLQAPPDLETVEITVDEVAIEQDVEELQGWSYRTEDNAIYFWGDAIPPRGSEVVIHYWTAAS
jgi:hypothetical protein